MWLRMWRCQRFKGISMKFKFIFILFNLVIIISFLAIYLMPLIMIDWDHARDFWSRNWGLPALFLAILCLLNTYFILNWRMFTLLEAEDWPALIAHLERRVYAKKMIVSQQVKILTNTYLVRSDLEAIRKLEDFLREHKAKVLPKFALSFGIPYLLQNDAEEMKRYFSGFADMKGRDGSWMRWNYAFALILQGDSERAEATLVSLCTRKTEPVLTLLTIYLLHSLKPETGDAPQVEEKRSGLLKKYTRGQWKREMERSKDSVQVVILQKLVEEATEWLYGESEAGEQSSATVIH